MRSTLFVLACSLALPGPSRGDGPDFTRDIRPILAKHCFVCHGPDENRKGDLRLDVRGDAVEYAIVPGHPDKSELIERIFSNEPSRLMPPPATKTTLSDEQKKLLKEWIAKGAEYQEHWAFVPPRPPALPAVKQKEWVRNPIDAFVLSRVEARGWRPSPEADRYTLIRRVSLDLIGLPPTPQEVDAFVNDSAPDAYEKLVDRLLQSKHYGERWARRWLDLARYADTNGYEKDRKRTIWPYRDWVIQALNRDMPFDQFTIEQLAGDMLPDPSPDQIVATGFHRNTMLNEEGGIDPLEFRYHAVVDRINTTGTAWLGLTLSCAQCHTHKYDPITHREYFEMMAFFNNAEEPDYRIPDPDIARRRAEIEKKVDELKAQLSAKFPGGAEALDRGFEKWAGEESGRVVGWRVIRPTKMTTTTPFLRQLDDGSILAEGDLNKSDTYELTFDESIQGVTALRLEALPHPSLPENGPGRTYYEGRKGDFFLSELSLMNDAAPVRIKSGSHDHANAAFGAGKVGAQYCFDGKAETGWSTTDRPGEPHAAVFNFEKPVDLKAGALLTMLFERHYACGLGRFRISVTTDSRHAVATSHGAEVEAILARPAEKRSAEQRERLLQRYLEAAPELAEARKQIEQLRAAMPQFQLTMVMQERPADNPRPTHIHHRGEFMEPKKRVEPGTPSVLHPFPREAPRDRLAFARWLVRPENPLTARVTVNRQWHAFFGRGIVKTVEDFGIQGEFPSHPELLDWLALEFIREGWSMKKLHRLIVTSATYRQASHASEEHLKGDPENRLLARGPRLRLEAELIRDSILRASGQLSGKLGGPSVFPPQPASLTTEGVYGGIKWTPSSGEDRYRRGLYTFLKRSIPYGMFSTFDGVTGETCIARREVSNTPLQALSMLNDLVIIEAAQALGKTIAGMPGTDQERMTTLFRRCLVRHPTERELTLLDTFRETQMERLRQGELNAKVIAGSGAGDAIQRAAWTLTARAVLNLDELITKE